RVGGRGFQDIHADVPDALGLTGGEIDIPFAVDEMNLGRPDVGAHRAVGMLAPDDLGFGGGEFAERAGATQFDPVVFGDGGGEIIITVGVKNDVRVRPLCSDG